jgi:transposase
MGVRCGTEYPLLPLGDYHKDGSLRLIIHSVSWRKLIKILEKCKIYIGVRDVAVEIRPYKTRDAFTNLSSPPPST